eukprot:9465190-Pyramimonas_sp.AAC.1
MADRNDGKVWACKATRLCGYQTNYQSRSTCWVCERDRDGKPTTDAPPWGRKPSRRPSLSKAKLPWKKDCGDDDHHPAAPAANAHPDSNGE